MNAWPPLRLSTQFRARPTLLYVALLDRMRGRSIVVIVFGRTPSAQLDRVFFDRRMFVPVTSVARKLELVFGGSWREPRRVRLGFNSSLHRGAERQ